MGLRSLKDTSLMAYVGGVEMALSHFVGEGGVCSQLAPVLGRMEGNVDSKWTDLVA